MMINKHIIINIIVCKMNEIINLFTCNRYGVVKKCLPSVSNVYTNAILEYINSEFVTLHIFDKPA